MTGEEQRALNGCGLRLERDLLIYHRALFPAEIAALASR
jgi:hypothetical protein